MTIRPMSLDDYPAVNALWRRTEHIGLNESDTPEAIGMFLQRNPGMSSVAVSPSGDIVGVVLCGHDGRRGCLHHLAVESSYRGQGIASRLIARCFDRLATEGIQKCNIVVFTRNETGGAFWQHNGWTLRNDLHFLQKAVD